MGRNTQTRHIQTAVKQAVTLHKSGKLDEAERRYRAVLRLQPENPDALHFLGLLLYRRGDVAAGTESVRRATIVAPGYADAFNNLGNLLKLAGRFEEAEDAYRQAVKLRPADADAHSNLGVVLRACGLLRDAEAEFREALAIDARHVPAYTNLGHLLKRAGRTKEAIACYRAAIALDPENPMGQHVLGRAYQASGEPEKARRVFQAWLDRDPGNPVALHMLSACSGDATPARASDAYVRTLFDDIADGFDEHLANLGYRAPHLIAAAVAGAWPRALGGLDVLDAGCGTGLCGAFLRPHARVLVGVDLSSGMLRRAKTLNVYDQLIEAELTGFLEGHPDAYDAIVSADTLCYFGDLEAVFKAAAGALKPSGRLFLTVEKAPDSASDSYHLQSHGRFNHAASYVRRQLEGTGFAVGTIQEAELRQEAGASVLGLVVTAIRHARL
jgi:predicted TPR repeat methyltransferase